MHLPKSLLVALYLFLGACHSASPPQVDNSQLPQSAFPVVLDSFSQKAENCQYKWLGTAGCNPLYIGTWADTIKADYELQYYPPLPPPPPPPGSSDTTRVDTSGYRQKLRSHKMFPYYVDWLSPKNFPRYNEATLSIEIDTTQIARGSVIGPANCRACPVLVRNLGTDTVAVGYGSFIPIITEAKDSANNWLPIEKRWIYMCGNGVGTIILPPNEILLTSAIAYSGTYKTEFRLKMGNSYSNTFRGSMHYTQFKSRYE